MRGRPRIRALVIDDSAFSRQAITRMLEASPKRPAASAAEGKGATVLLVEDYEVARMALEEYLSEIGFEVLPAGTAAAAERLAEAHRGEIDVILTDLGLPDGSGAELVDRLRSTRPGMPAVYLSGRADDSEVEAVARRHHAPFLKKPIELDQVAQTLGRAISRREAGR